MMDETRPSNWLDIVRASIAEGYSRGDATYEMLVRYPFFRRNLAGFCGSGLDISLSLLDEVPADLSEVQAELVPLYESRVAQQRGSRYFGSRVDLGVPFGATAPTVNGLSAVWLQAYRNRAVDLIPVRLWWPRVMRVQEYVAFLRAIGGSPSQQNAALRGEPIPG